MKKILIIITALVMSIALVGCGGAGENKSRTKSEKLSDQATSQQMDAVPYPASQLRDSLERRNLKKKLLIENKANLPGYVYILSFGKFIGYYTIIGKVSSLQSQMNPTDDIQKWVCPGSCSDVPGVVTESAGDDGSYGEDEPGIFFFTADGVLIKTSADYIYSTQPITAGNIPELNK